MLVRGGSRGIDDRGENGRGRGDSPLLKFEILHFIVSVDIVVQAVCVCPYIVYSFVVGSRTMTTDSVSVSGYVRHLLCFVGCSLFCAVQ